MSSYAFAGLLGEDKADQLRGFTAEITGPRKAEHDDYMRRYNLVKEDAWIQATAMGEIYTIYLESTKDFLTQNRLFAASAHPFDVWYKQEVGAALGEDFNQALPVGFVETLFESHEPWATGHETPTCQAIPVLPVKTDAVRQMAVEIAGARSAEMHESHRRGHVSAEILFLEHTPQGDFVVYFNEAENAAGALEEFATSQDPYDVWYRDMVKELTGIDYSQPIPAGALPELILRSGVGEPVLVGGVNR